MGAGPTRRRTITVVVAATVVAVTVGGAGRGSSGASEGWVDPVGTDEYAIELVGDDAFVARPVDEPLAVVSEPIGEGYAVLPSVTGFALDSYTVQLIDSPGVGQLRGYAEAAAAQIAAITGLSVSVAPGTFPEHSPNPGEVLVRVANSSACGPLTVPGTAGCGGPRTFAGEVVTGEVSVAPQLPCDDLGISVVAHELGHAFGLAHYSSRVDGLLQLMFPSTNSGAPAFRSGDRAGLAALAGRPAITTTRALSSLAVATPADDGPVDLGPPPVPGDASSQAFTSGLFSQPAVTRVLDTRADGRTLVPGQVLDLSLVPWIGSAPVDAVAMNVTGTGARGLGFLTVFPTGSAPPATSNLNFTPMADTANLVIVKVGANNSVSFIAGEAGVDLAVDMFGVFSPAGAYAYVASDPARVFDTRESAVPGERGFPLGCGDHRTVDTARLRAAGVPVADAAAAVVNLTAVDPNADGFVSLRGRNDVPARGVDAATSNLNLRARDTRANLAISPGVPWLGQVSNSMAGDLVADVSGWFVPPAFSPDATRLLPVDPTRIADSRLGLALSGRFAPSETRSIGIPLPGGFGPSDVTAVIVNVTATGTSGNGYLTLSPTGIARPVVSNVNYDATDSAVPNLAIVRLGANASVDVFASDGSPDVVVDVMGYFVRR